MKELNEIIPYILDDKCILFIGAGLSIFAGCYDWDSILKEMIKQKDIKREIKLSDVEKSRFTNDEWLAFCRQELVRSGKENDFLGIVRKAVTPDPIKFTKTYLPLVRKIREIKPFPNIITTNIDNCLEEARIVEFNKIFYKFNDFNVNNLNSGAIFHIRGYMEALGISSLAAPMHQEYSGNQLRKFLKKIFSNYSVFFVGYSFRDEAIRGIISQAKKNKQHFALIPTEDGFSSTEIALLSSYNIKVIIYGSRNKFSSLLINWIDGNFVKKAAESEEESEQDG